MSHDSGQELETPVLRWRPTKEFLMSNPRSAELRGVNLGIVNRLNKLLHDPEVAESRDKQSQIYAELEAQGGKLIELGIKPEMHVGKALEEFKSDPVAITEYIAGQLYEATGHQVTSERAAVPIVQVFSEANIGEAHILEGLGKLPEKLKDFIKMRTRVSSCYSFLDTQPGEENI